jgi:3-oxoacyl-[acyl-carrier-protein] synthase II
MRRVVVTGAGAVTPLGLTADDTWQAMVAGKSGIGPITLFDASDYSVRIAGEVKDFEPQSRLDAKASRRMDRYCQLALFAAVEAVANSGLTFEDEPERKGVLIGSGIGGIDTLLTQHNALLAKGPSRVSPFLIPMMISNMASGNFATMTGAKGPCLTVVTACASAAHAIGEAYHIIQRDDADVMVAGGSEAAVGPIALSGFANMTALSSRNDDPEGASRPFDADRDGFVMSEGAGIVVLEEYEYAKKRGAPILGEIVGYGLTGDAHHMTQPAPRGEGARRAMQMALRKAGLNPEEVDYINAHGTSTQFNDACETDAVKDTFGDHARTLVVSSTKSMTGHLLGAAGGVEMLACLMAIRDGVVPPTINYQTPDPHCDLDYVPNTAREIPVNVAMSNSFGFGGQNAVLIARRI